MRLASVLALSCSVWLAAHAAPARELKVAFGQEKAPYLWVEGNEVRGLEYDIVKAILAVSGDSMASTILPNRRVTIALVSNEVDIVTGMQMHQAGEGFYSDEYMTYANYAITRKSKAIHLGSLADIFGHSVAIWQNAWEDLHLSRFHPNGPNGLDYTEFTSQYRQSKFFWVGRADINIIDRNIFLWYSRQLAGEVDMSDELEYQNIVPVLRVRAAFRSPAERDDFNAGLKAVKANGEIDRIFARYGLSNPDGSGK